MKKVLAVGKSIYHGMPACLRCFVSPARLITRFLSVLTVSLWIVAGEEISTRQNNHLFRGYDTVESEGMYWTRL